MPSKPQVVYEQTPHTFGSVEAPPPREPVERVDLFEDGCAFVLRNVLSPEECEAYMAAATAMGMSSVQAGGYERRIRVCDRVSASSDELAAKLFERIRPFVAPIDLRSTDRPRGIPANRARAEWRPHGLNEMWRICRYKAGGHFQPHLDGGHDRSATDRSMLTFMLYLNSSDDFEGGATRFFSDRQQAYRAPDESKVLLSYAPRRGEALVFHSELLHDGEALRGTGQKWIMRSEVMFEVASTAADDHLRSLFDGLERGGHETAGQVVVGIEPTIDAVRGGRAATVLVSAGVTATRDGQPLARWLAQQLAAQQQAQQAQQPHQRQQEWVERTIRMIPIDALSGGGQLFLRGLEGVAALLIGGAGPDDGSCVQGRGAVK